MSDWSITADGVLLRALVPEDRQRWSELIHDPVQRAFGAPAFVKLPDGPEGLSERVVESQAAAGTGAPATLAICSAADPDRFLGTTGHRLAHAREMGVTDIGYGVHPDARGSGVASRAVRLLVDWLLLAPDGPRFERVQLDHSVENEASCRVALNAGLAREGVHRGFMPLPEPAGGVRRHDVCAHGTVVADRGSWPA